MIGSLKIKAVKINGEDRVPPECMRLLMEFADHRRACEQCETAWDAKTGRYCVTGAELLRELVEQPEVSFQPEAS